MNENYSDLTLESLSAIALSFKDIVEPSQGKRLVWSVRHLFSRVIEKNTSSDREQLLEYFKITESGLGPYFIYELLYEVSLVMEIYDSTKNQIDYSKISTHMHKELFNKMAKQMILKIRNLINKDQFVTHNNFISLLYSWGSNDRDEAV